MKRKFINISNHSSQKWDEEQKRVALEYGDIIDIDFPQVDPFMSSEQLNIILESLISKIKDMKLTPIATTFHIMGEMTLTYKLVSYLKSGGFKCLASTTFRNIIDQGEGKVVHSFKFVRFREY